MKKLISMIVAAMMLSISAHAATTYDIDNKSVTTDDTNTYQTVLISKGKDVPTSADEIVYVNQADVNSTFDAGTEFLLKNSVDKGVYTVRFGGDSTTSSVFYIGTGIKDCDYEMKNVGEEQAENDTYILIYYYK